MKWYEPDNRWGLYDIKCEEEFIEKLVVTGKFHSKVPKDIIDAFDTVSYLLAHSYYHWPLQDEALNKALLIMEMGVKLKAKELGVDLKKGSRDKRLVDLIEEVCQEKLKFLKHEFDRVRNMRNNAVHRDSYFYMGALGMAKSNFMLFNNIINLLFLDLDDLEKLIERKEQIKQELSFFQKGNFVLEHNDSRILIDQVVFHKYSIHKNKELLLLVVNPILINAYDMFTSHRFDNPLILTLSKFKINELKLEAKDLNNNPVKIEETFKCDNLIKFSNYYDELERVSQHDIQGYIAYNTHNALLKMEELIYSNVW